MKHFPNDPSAADRLTYRRSVGGLYLSYSVALIACIGMTFVHRPAYRLQATNESQILRLKSTPSIGLLPITAAVTKP